MRLGQDGKDNLCRTYDQHSSDQLLEGDRRDMEWLCSQEELPCHGQASASCPIESWCFSPDVFALAFVEDSEACSELKDIPCASISAGAIGALLDGSGNSTAHEEALACLVDRCEMYSLASLRTGPKHTLNEVAGYGAAVLGMSIAALVFMYRTFREPSDTETVCRQANEISALELMKVSRAQPMESDAKYMLEEVTNGSIHHNPINFGTTFLGMLLSAVVVLFRTALVDGATERALPAVRESEAEAESQR
jgi:hypothetical protein